MQQREWMKSLTFAVLCLLGAVAAGSAQAQCDLQITEAFVCREYGKKGLPHAGEPFGLFVRWNVVGKPAKAFSIRYTMAGQTQVVEDVNTGPGQGYNQWIQFPLPLDGEIPFSVTLDPENVSGDINKKNNTVKGRFTPIPPTRAVEYFNSRVMRGWQNLTVSFEPSMGRIDELAFLFGCPSTHTHQRVLEAAGPKSSKRVITQPAGDPAFEYLVPAPSPGNISSEHSFLVELKGVRVNPKLLQKISWKQLENVPEDVAVWLKAEFPVEKDHPDIAAFVKRSLPENYRSSIAPYDAARQLHLAVMKHMKYGDPKGGGALNALRSGQGQCGCFANLLVASLRNIGIPARSVFGFWEGKTAWHVWAEFYIPGPGWIPADPSHGKVNYEHSSTYAVAFGTMPDLNKRCVVAVGHDHQLGSRKVDHLHQPAHFWSGTAKFLRWESQTDLQPDKSHMSSK